MSLKRKALAQLKQWRADPGHRALLITGARQVGKTYLVREFARARYDAFLEINFVRTPDAADIFEGNLDASTIIAGLTAFSRKALVPGKTLIFLDEIQECPRARTAIKFLVDDGRFDYIESGSLLGVRYKEVPSYPVGYETELRMYPLTLEEFFDACGIQPEVFEHVRACFSRRAPLPVAMHERLLKLFRLYLVVGGMPAAVQEFVDSSDLARVLKIQTDVLAQYRQDIARYASDKAHVHAIFDHIPAELDKKNKRFKLSDLAKSARMERYASDFMWLADAGVALPCYNVTEPKAPLAINVRHSLLKVFLCDVGLLSAATGGGVQFDILQGNIDVNWGSMLENAIAQQLVAHGFDLYYYDKQKIGEVDFLLQDGKSIVPLEAKSGKDFRQHAALDNLLAMQEWHLDSAYVLCTCNIEQAEKVVYLPWYALVCIEPIGLPSSFVIDMSELT
ncbi:ATP-binding protein [Gordonibacter massiliensis (ex Traore et al. 2017)]|uniref:ATP-binding protein n=1 Tax=Gordonibacter massiliensis (ex Traore et al. 2017) TaxID=1841863 RepID=UPI001C8CA2A1|nr:AAA family ATPase [Gordonibacter massiliensis (ex Traore et al. 2017)]MBX9033480.1 ATP-binding protein [Gordonibacter massiliensis (ex Traore et al. 2017)]